MTGQKLSISIITPTYNMLAYLKMCCASVRDQEVVYEHIVIDGGSTDGTPAWLPEAEVSFVSEKDKGMYNALNKGIRKSTGDIIGHLNADEQYLPGTLKFVVQFFNDHPEIDFIAADFLIINPDGEFLAYRKGFQPRWPYFFSNYLYTTTCTLFYRRKIFEENSFNENYRSIADVIFLYDVLRKGNKGMHVKKYFAVFTYSGTNLSLNPISGVEKKAFLSTLPTWYRIARPLFFVLFFFEKIMNGAYFEKAVLSYSIFTKKNLVQRTTITKHKPNFRLEFK